jgi:hypothetical protein
MKRVILFCWLCLLVGLAACSASENNPGQSATESNQPDEGATVSALTTRIAENSGLAETARAIESAAAQPTIPFATITPDPPTPTLALSETPLAPDLPEDIPLPPGELRDLFSSRSLVSFMNQSNFSQLVLFYESQMPARGWEKQPGESYITSSAALLHYTKDARHTSISFRLNPISNLTAIVITLQE